LVGQISETLGDLDEGKTGLSILGGFGHLQAIPSHPAIFVSTFHVPEPVKRLSGFIPQIPRSRIRFRAVSSKTVDTPVRREDDVNQRLVGDQQCIALKATDFTG
jgi:hypothetical protein